jgi:phosphatidate cytidylyltransferase
MTDPVLLRLLIGTIGVLLVATLFGDWLRRRHSPDGTNTAIENFNTRLAAWWVMVIFVGAAFLLGRTTLILLFALLSFSALREFLTLTSKARGDHLALAAAFFVILPLQYWFVGTGRLGLVSILIPVYAFLFLPVVSALSGSPRDFLTRVSETQWGLMVCVYAVSHVPALMDMPIPGYEGHGLRLIAWFLIVAQASDELHYIWGRILGSHPVLPAISRSKSWEGLAGSLVSSALIGAALHAITPFAAWQAGVMAFAVALMGFLGGIVMSAIKRDRGVKDWGHMIAGHGGFLDRLDSVVFAAPLFFHLTRYFWAGA